jgi:hypothetical protein
MASSDVRALLRQSLDAAKAGDPDSAQALAATAQRLQRIDETPETATPTQPAS